MLKEKTLCMKNSKIHGSAEKSHPCICLDGEIFNIYLVSETSSDGAWSGCKPGGSEVRDYWLIGAQPVAEHHTENTRQDSSEMEKDNRGKLDMSPISR